MHSQVKVLDFEGGSHWRSSSWLEWGYPRYVWRWPAGFESSLGPPKQTNLKLYQQVKKKITTPSFKSNHRWQLVKWIDEQFGKWKNGQLYNE